MSDRLPTYDTIIIGSGFGGSVIASKLANAGARVAVLERGPWWGASGAWGESERHRNFPNGWSGLTRVLRGVHWGGKRTSWAFRARSDGLYEVHQLSSLSCLVASGVGGGSLVYTNMLVAPPQEHFDAYPPEISSSVMEPFFDEIRQFLKPTQDFRPHRKAEAFKRAALSISDGEISHPDLAINFDAARGGAADHPCLLGSSDLSKQSMDNTYLRHAAAMGATIRALCEVETLVPPNNHRGWQVRYRDLLTGRAQVVQAAQVVVAAGSLGTLKLLFHARDSSQTLPHISNALGRNFSPNGDVASLVLGAKGKIDSGAGPSSTVLHRVDEERSFLTGEFGLPLSSLPPIAQKRLSGSAILFSMGADHISAEVTSVRGNLKCTLGRSDDSDLYDRIVEHAARLGAGYGAKRLLVNAPFGPESQRILTVHPIGGMPMGNDPSKHVIDHSGQVHRYPGLYVGDGSVLQESPGVPPSLTIAALAARQAQSIIQSTCS